MKLNTTLTVYVKIPVSVENVEHIEFIIKRHKDSIYPALIHKVYAGKDILYDEEYTQDCFIVLLPFTAKETMSLPVGEVYMDTLIVMKDGSIPPINILKIDVSAIIFEETG